MNPVIKDMAALSEHHKTKSSSVRSGQRMVHEKSELITLLSRLMKEQSQMLAEVVSEYERCAVDLEQAFGQIQAARALQESVQDEVRAAANFIRDGNNKDAIRLLNDVALRLEAPI